MILLVDIGNTNLHWGMVDNITQTTNIDSYHTVSHNQTKLDSQILDQLWQSYPQPEKIFCASVVADTMQKTFNTWAQQKWQQDVCYATTGESYYDLKNAYGDSKQLGIDRWLAMVGAWHQYTHQNICVVDCGTAITLDIISADGQHQGGYIIPSQQMMQTSLLSQTNGINQLYSLDNIKLELGNNTQQSVMHGIYFAITSFINQAVARYSHDSDQFICLITGGGAKHVKPYLAGDFIHDPELVLLGLLLWHQYEP